jgi:hypothetical protein
VAVPTWFRRRRYYHFDEPVSAKKAGAVATDPQQVATHAFYPFLTFKKVTSKVKRDPATNKLEQKAKERPLSYCAHMDAHIFAYYSSKLSELYEREVKAGGLHDVVVAFRSGHGSNITIAKEAFAEIAKRGNCTAVALDIEKFFDRLDHEVLRKVWAELLGVGRLPADHFAVFKAITRYSSVDLADLKQRLGLSSRHRQSKRRRLCDPDYFRAHIRAGGLVKRHTDPFGIPQGSPISALLSNLYLLDFDTAFNAKVKALGGRYFRYCDDILVVLDDSQANAIEIIATNELKNSFKLTIQHTKTARVKFSKSSGSLSATSALQYLGFTFDGQRVLIRSASIARYQEKMRRGIRVAKRTMEKVNSARMGRGLPPRPLFLRQIYSRYTHLGRRNFITYGYRAAEEIGAASIKRQLRRYWRRVNEEIKK